MKYSKISKETRKNPERILKDSWKDRKPVGAAISHTASVSFNISQHNLFNTGNKSNWIQSNRIKLQEKLVTMGTFQTPGYVDVGQGSIWQS